MICIQSEACLHEGIFQRSSCNFKNMNFCQNLIRNVFLMCSCAINSKTAYKLMGNTLFIGISDGNQLLGDPNCEAMQLTIKKRQLLEFFTNAQKCQFWHFRLYYIHENQKDQ